MVTDNRSTTGRIRCKWSVSCSGRGWGLAFFRKKYHRGQWRVGKWVVGLMERASGRCWMEVVVRQDAPTLEHIISNHVFPETTTVTDVWRGYQNVAQLNNGVWSRRHCACSRVCWLDPDIHTESIEGLLMQAIRKLRYHSGTSRGLFESNFSQFQWHNSHKQNVFDCYLQMLCAKCSRLHQNCTTCLLMFSFNTVNQRKCIKWSLLISAVVILPVLKGSLKYISGSWPAVATKPAITT